MISQKVVLVNEKNKKIGVEEKLKAHKEGKLHRAISVLIFNSKGKSFYNREKKQNIIVVDYGLMLFVHIHNQMKHLNKQHIED